MKQSHNRSFAFLDGFCKGVAYVARALFGIVKYTFKAIVFVISALLK